MTQQFLLPSEPIETLAEYLDAGGGRGLEQALRLGELATIETVTSAGVRGRGGAGFPAGRKWLSVREGGAGLRFVVANGAEGEPATFKDRTLMRRDPYRIVEGAAIAAFAVGAGTVYLATKRSYRPEVRALTRAALEMTGQGMLQELSVNIVEGPDDYLYGEEKALLEVVEGRDPLPRLLPPYELGLFATASAIGWEAGSRPVSVRDESNPTVVNNVETLATAAHVLANGVEWFRSMGTAESPGQRDRHRRRRRRPTRRARSRDGARRSPTVLEELCGGPLRVDGSRRRSAVCRTRCCEPTAFDVPLTYEDFAARGTGLGAAGFVVYDDTVNMALVAHELSRFLAVESCGQCPPCKQGSLAITLTSPS
jgi:NADH:ubiquinone oxidoreductase subunit F (NADH-binding)